MSENNENSSHQLSVSEPVPNLVTPNTERAVQDIIKNSHLAATSEPPPPPVAEATTPTNAESSSEAPPPKETNAVSGPSQAAAVVPTPTHTRIAAPPGDDNFENLQKAVQILGKAKQLDEMKRFDEALKLYRQGVDMLLEELIIRQGTEQSRSYLRDKCNDFMNRIDQLKLIIQIEKVSAENKENQTAGSKVATTPTAAIPPTTTAPQPWDFQHS